MLRDYPKVNYTLWEAKRPPVRDIMTNRCATLVQDSDESRKYLLYELLIFTTLYFLSNLKVGPRYSSNRIFKMKEIYGLQSSKQDRIVSQVKIDQGAQ